MLPDVRARIGGIVRLIDADALRERLAPLDQLSTDSYGNSASWEPAINEVLTIIAAAPALRCDVCKYAGDRAVVDWETELHEPGDAVFSCGNGVSWCLTEPDENPADFSCSLWEAR